ncbi:MAG: hypothetical protein KF716_15045 [Anaerolineae bacterium]|nr:hypothetical protein [Anaerolineae bacterium]
MLTLEFRWQYETDQDWRLPVPGILRDKYPEKSLYTPTDDGLIYSRESGHLRADPEPTPDGYRILRPAKIPSGPAIYFIRRIKESDFQALEALRKGVK